MIKAVQVRLVICFVLLLGTNLSIAQSNLVFEKGYDFSFTESLELYSHSIKQRKELAKTDPSKHYFFIGENYRTGINAKQDIKKAEKFFKKSAESDKNGTMWTALSYYHLALLKLYESANSKANDLEALDLLRKSADQKCSQAGFNLGMANYKGNDGFGIGINWSKAEHRFRQSEDNRAYAKLSKMHSDPGISYGLIARARRFKTYSVKSSEMAFFRSKMKRYRSYHDFEKLHKSLPDFFDIELPPIPKGEIITDTDAKIKYVEESKLDNFFDEPVENSMVKQCLHEMIGELFGNGYKVESWKEYATYKDLLRDVCGGKDKRVWSSIEGVLETYFKSYAQSLVHSESVTGVFEILDEFITMHSGMYAQERELLKKSLIESVGLCPNDEVLKSLRYTIRGNYPAVERALSNRIMTIDWNRTVGYDHPIMYERFLWKYPDDSTYGKMARDYLAHEENYLTYSSLKRLFASYRDEPDVEAASLYILYRLKDIMHTSTKFSKPSRVKFIRDYLHIIDEDISTQTSRESGVLTQILTWENVYKGEIVLGINSSLGKDLVHTIDYPSTLLEWYFSDDFVMGSNWQEVISHMPMDEISLVFKAGQFKFQQARRYPALLNSGSYNIMRIPRDYRLSTKRNLTLFGKVVVVGGAAGFGIGTAAAVLTPTRYGTAAACYEKQEKRKSAFSKPRYVKFDIKCYDGRLEIVELDTQTGKYAKMIRYKSFFQLKTFDEAARLKCSCDD